MNSERYRHIAFWGASVADTEGHRNAIAGAPDPALQWKRERTAGVGTVTLSQSYSA